MSLKSIIDIDVNDAKFAAYKSAYDKYRASLQTLPAAWRAVNAQIQGGRPLFDHMVDRMVEANTQAKIAAKAQEVADRRTRTTADRWASMARTTRTVAGNIKEGTVALLKWSGIIGAVTGLLGAGGIWGIDRLAQGVSSSRRSSLGAGTTVGGQAAFASNIQQLMSDPELFLGAIGHAKMDLSQRVGLITAGLSPADIAGDTTNAAVKVLRTLMREADTWNPGQYQQRLDAYQQSGFATPELLAVLRGTPADVRERLLGQVGSRRSQFELAPDVTQKWQDFSTQLSNAGKAIETVFIRKLSLLEPGLGKLSDAVQKTISTFLASPALGQWLDKADKGLERFARLCRHAGLSAHSGIFRRSHRPTRFGDWQLSIFVWPRWRQARCQRCRPRELGSAPSGRPQHRRRDQSGAGWREVAVANLRGNLHRAGPENNPGNLRPPGASTGFQQFGSPEAGVAAMARQLQLYENRDHLDTLSKIISRYAPASENDTGSYIADVPSEPASARSNRSISTTRRCYQQWSLP